MPKRSFIAPFKVALNIYSVPQENCILKNPAIFQALNRPHVENLILYEKGVSFADQARNRSACKLFLGGGILFLLILPGTASSVLNRAEIDEDLLGMDWGPPDLVTIVKVYSLKGRSLPMEIELVSVDSWINLFRKLR